MIDNDNNLFQETVLFNGFALYFVTCQQPVIRFLPSYYMVIEVSHWVIEGESALTQFMNLKLSS